MSGYLQRLARSVTQPTGNVHPVVGSVFAAPDHERAKDLVEDNVTAVAPAAIVSLRGQSLEDPKLTAPETIMPVQTVISTPLIVSAPATPEAAHRERASSEPLLQPSPIQDRSSGRKTEADSPAESARNAQHAGPSHPPLLAPAHLRRAPTQIAKPGKGAAARLATESLPWRAEQTQDDVQIHIGRVEVTAIQQMPARPPSRPLHKGPSLDEYLKRRDGRG